MTDIRGFERTSRRRLLRMLGAGGVAAAGATAVAGCASGTGAASSNTVTGHSAGAAAGAPATRPSGPATLMIVRHAEKPPDSGNPRGIDANGDNDKHSLVVTGWARAGALVELFASTRNPPAAGLLKPDALYASLGGDSKSQRPMQTLLPLAARLGQNINTTFGKGSESNVAAELAARSGTTLVAWEHEAIPAIVAGLGTVDPTPPSKWPDGRFDMVWVFSATGPGWRFHQVPQLLLAGDSPNPIL